MTATRPTPITQKKVAAFLKPRPKDSHKGMFGTVTAIGGSNGMVGAAILAGRAALKMGAGCVHIGLLADKMPMVDMRVPELMLYPAHEALQSIPHPNPPPKGEGANVKSNSSPSVLLIGCGLGRSLAAQKLLYDALLLDVPLVLDADALNIIAQRPDLRGMLHTRKAPAVFTPHPGEAAHLLACKAEDIQRDRNAAARELAKRLGGSVVLKGAGSLCATRDGKLHLNQTGNPGMSSAGMGDVLAGMIAAFIAQGLNADEAMLLAVHLHGAAGDELAKQQATLGMSATEVIEWARWLLNRMAPK
ncbi:NAD(P)H-hydrate dehydratase [Sideroxydans lithotrophicus]|uniref:ADP-dependent (S)-NAD(P)H-hydrate dehydratase n=1 Tax=Sideroxydans lithotrophicus (strain ES-1) TaxID=580332 RepID=D5CTU2_SIDLE|nr:NAD(P)H-hydrate dehydratase [Sideroxydans lithotrophicus]ADE12254.1 carbohydrate kinase, YjeF related protein [Sideroxydans lithotrophicus ES-1]